MAPPRRYCGTVASAVPKGCVTAEAAVPHGKVDWVMADARKNQGRDGASQGRLTWAARVGVLAAAAAMLLVAPGCRMAEKASVADRLVNPSPDVRRQVNEELIQMGPRAVPVLERDIRATGNPEVRREALLALGRVGSSGLESVAPATRALARILLRKPDPQTKVLTIAALRFVGPRAIPELADMIAHIEIQPTAREASPVVELAAVMLEIDRRTTIQYLIGMLSLPEYSKYQANIIEYLRLMTKQDLGYRPNASAEEKRKAVEAWQQWWLREGSIEGVR